MLNIEKMKIKISEKGYYVTKYYDWKDGVQFPVYELSHDTKKVIVVVLL